MDDQQSPKKRAIRQDRVTLKSEALGKLNQWSKQLGDRIKGTKISRSDIVDWLIESHADSLSDDEISDLEKSHFDEVKFAEWAVTQLKKARANGSITTLADLLKQSMLS